MIDILLATYNGERYIREQLDSLLNQTIQDIHIIANDDGSDDGTFAVLQEYRKQYPGIFDVSQVKCGGAAANFMYLMSRMDEDIVMFCDQDDVWKPDKIEISLKKFLEIQDPEKPCLVYSDLEVVDEDLKPMADSQMQYQNLDGTRNQPQQLMLMNVVTGCTIMCNRRCVEMTLQATDIKKIRMHDGWLAMIASQFGHIAFINESLICYRQHRENAVGAKKNTGFRYITGQLSNISKIKDILRQTRAQAKYFDEIYGCPLFGEYGQLMKKNKIQRIHFYVANDVLYPGLIENIGLCVFG